MHTPLGYPDEGPQKVIYNGHYTKLRLVYERSAADLQSETLYWKTSIRPKAWKSRHAAVPPFAPAPPRCHLLPAHACSSLPCFYLALKPQHCCKRLSSNDDNVGRTPPLSNCRRLPIPERGIFIVTTHAYCGCHNYVIIYPVQNTFLLSYKSPWQETPTCMSGETRLAEDDTVIRAACSAYDKVCSQYSIIGIL